MLSSIYIVLQFLSYDLNGVLILRLIGKTKKGKQKKYTTPSPPSRKKKSYTYLLSLKISKISYLYLRVLEQIERGFLEHWRACATQVSTKTTIIMERDNIDDHNNVVEILIGLHWCNTISATLFFTTVHLDNLCKSGYISSKSWMDLL